MPLWLVGLACALAIGGCGGNSGGEGSRSASGSIAGLPPGVPAYDGAKQICGDRKALQALPPQSRHDAELIAGTVEGFASPGDRQDAHDGCLAGLKSLGIE